MQNNKAYGIYLGAEYASIAYAENGKATSAKIDVTDDIMPCCVHIHPDRSIIVGKKAQNCSKAENRRSLLLGKAPFYNTFYNFRHTMGTDKRYVSANMDGREYSSEELSAEVLKALKSFITDEDFKSVVITVPARFNANQKTATIKAAKLAGFNHVELLQEPIAAAMAYGLTSAQKDGYWLVFDFGGGTFDAALIKVEDGIIQVFDTEGDNYLGGKNLDYAIVDNILMPYLQRNYSIDGFLANPTKKDILREAMKTYTEEIKNELSFKDSYSIYVDPGDLGEDEDGEEFEIDLTVTKDEVYDVIKPLFQKAVDICKDLLKRNNLASQQLGKLILVGGPTHSPLVRQMLKEQVSLNVDSSINPMTAVAQGAALWCEKFLMNNPKSDSKPTLQYIVLDIPHDKYCKEDSIWVPISLVSDIEPVKVRFVRFDGWQSELIIIDKCGDVVELSLLPDTNNEFSIQCELQDGSLISNIPGYIEINQCLIDDFRPVLPYTIATTIIHDGIKVATPIPGLQCGNRLPVVGIHNGFKLSHDKFKMPLYQCDKDCEMRNVAICEYIGDIVIPDSLTKDVIDEPVDITIKVDTNEEIIAEIYIPSKNRDIRLLVEYHYDTMEEIEYLFIEEVSNILQVIREKARQWKDVSALAESLNSIIGLYIHNNDIFQIKCPLRELLKKIY